MRKYNIASCIFLLSLLYLTYGFNRRWPTKRPTTRTSNEFDVLIFTQHWPLTACFVWKKSSEKNSCSFPKHEEWTIHGIWPTKYNTKGPAYCNASLPFDKNAIIPIESQLRESWIDIHNKSQPYQFWKHEWDKHGTCAVEIKNLNSVFNYFRAGIKLLDTYNMMDILAKASILPGRKYMVQDMLLAIRKILNKKGQIMCTEDDETGELYVFEIRICFNKTLQLTDCDGIYNFPTNCDNSKQITYPSQVPHHYRVTQI